MNHYLSEFLASTVLLRNDSVDKMSARRKVEKRIINQPLGPFETFPYATFFNSKNKGEKRRPLDLLRKHLGI